MVLEIPKVPKIPQLINSIHGVIAVGVPEVGGDVPTPPTDGTLPEWRPPTGGTTGDSGLKSVTAVGEEVFWFDEPNCFVSDNQYATETTTGHKSSWKNCTFGVPSGATILGIEVAIEGKADSSATIEIELSWNGGSSFTNANKQKTYTSSEGTQTYGSSTDLWGRNWNDTELSNTNFRIRAEYISTGDQVYFDHIQAKVYYIT